LVVYYFKLKINLSIVNKITIIILTLNEVESLKVLLNEIHEFHFKNLIN